MLLLEPVALGDLALEDAHQVRRPVADAAHVQRLRLSQSLLGKRRWDGTEKVSHTLVYVGLRDRHMAVALVGIVRRTPAVSAACAFAAALRLGSRRRSGAGRQHRLDEVANRLFHLMALDFPQVRELLLALLDGAAAAHCALDVDPPPVHGRVVQPQRRVHIRLRVELDKCRALGGAVPLRA